MDIFDRRRVLAGGLAVACAAPALARAVELPQEAGVFVARVDGVLQALEAQLPHTGGGFGGFAGGKIGLVMQGPHSPVRFRAAQDFSFLVRMASVAINPSTPVFLWRARSLAKTRRAELGYSMGLGDVTGSPDVVAMTMEQPAERLLQFTPTQNLYPGEYMLGLWGQSGDTVSGMAYAFGLD